VSCPADRCAGGHHRDQDQGRRTHADAGVLCIEHGQLLEDATMRLLAEKGIWLSLQALDPAPPTAPESTRKKKAQVIDGTDAESVGQCAGVQRDPSRA
jgi:imidazolonepropionase-like amidohydrolase